MPPKTPTQTETKFKTFVGGFQRTYPRRVCVIFLMTPRTEKAVGEVALRKRNVVTLTPDAVKPDAKTRNQKIGGERTVNQNARAQHPFLIEVNKK